MLQPDIIKNFEQISNFIFVPTNENEYSQIAGLLDAITDIVRDNENHPLSNLMDVLGVLIENYEDRFIPEPESDPIAVLKHFMKEYHLKPDDLSELGGHDIISEILDRKRKLNTKQIKLLSERFNISESVFFNEIR